jgi:DNA ligase (NAD+)
MAALAGIIVPVAVLEPVKVGGVVIRRASLHNSNQAQSLDLHIPDTVVVERRGEVIPQVVRVLKERRPLQASPWKPPERCPACNQRLSVRTGNGKREIIPMLECVNTACKGKACRQLEHFTNVCIKGIGKQLVRLLTQLSLCETPVDLYHLTEHKKEVCCLHDLK